MAHVDKGNIGVWLQGADNIEVTNTEISNISQNSLNSLGSKDDYPAPNHMVDLHVA